MGRFRAQHQRKQDGPLHCLECVGMLRKWDERRDKRINTPQLTSHETPRPKTHQNYLSPDSTRVTQSTTCRAARTPCQNVPAHLAPSHSTRGSKASNLNAQPKPHTTLASYGAGFLRCLAACAHIQSVVCIVHSQTPKVPHSPSTPLL